MLHVEETDDLETCLELRRVVFVEEQAVPIEDERDADDASALHLLAKHNGIAVGTARVLSYGTTAKIGRVCVLKAHRGSGIGAALIEACQESAHRTGATRAILGAQTTALGFYERLGYRTYGDVFQDAGIAHQMMERSL